MQIHGRANLGSGFRGPRGRDPITRGGAVSRTSSIIHRDLHPLHRRSLRRSAFRERYKDRTSNDAAQTSPVQGPTLILRWRCEHAANGAWRVDCGNTITRPCPSICPTRKGRLKSARRPVEAAVSNRRSGQTRRETGTQSQGSLRDRPVADPNEFGRSPWQVEVLRCPI
jgi:hypothetical protein